jgi:6-pyruvoyltetrahydropterin/6-carboxytetrahydropterin synthase
MFEVGITKVFSATHTIHLPDGSLEPIHGHDWRVVLTVGTKKLNDLEWVMDFHELERLVDDVIAPARNGNLNEIGPFAGGRLSPTAERVAWWIGTEVAKNLPAEVSLLSVKVEEAPGCEATFRP